MGHPPDGALGEAPLNRRLFAACLVVGGAFMAFGVYSLLRKPVPPRDFVIWLGGGIVAHDLVAAPLIFAAGYVLRRFLPAWALAPIQAGLIATAVLVVFTLPSLGVPRNVANPSRLPNHYNRNLAVILALVWLGVLGGLVRARRRGRA
jgi:hypothetical protein